MGSDRREIEIERESGKRKLMKKDRDDVTMDEVMMRIR